MDKTQTVHKFLTEDLTVRVAVVIATQVVEEMRSLQNTYPVATVALGRAMVGSLLLASYLKENQELSLYFQGNGPLKSIFAEASHDGRTRAYTPNPQYMPKTESDRIAVGPAIGIGLLTVTHHLPNQREPHRGTVALRTGEIGDDIALYLQQSHQTPSVVSLGVHLDRYGRVEAAGGILIQAMPGVKEEKLVKIEKRVKNAAPISKRILEGAGVKELANDYLADFNLVELTHSHPINYHCPCTSERVARSMALLGLEELDHILQTGEKIVVTCQFCGRKYDLTEDEVRQIRQHVYKGSLN